VLRQSWAGLEIIVVDDGSTDNTEQRLQPYRSAIRYVKQPHAGVSAARNTGIRLATGEWIAFLDSDDCWLPHKLNAQMRYLEQHPACRICQTEEIWLRRGKRINPRKYHKKPSGYCFPLLLERCLVSPSAVVVHRDLFGEVGLFDEGLPACEDYDLWLRIGCRDLIGLLEEPLIIKRGGYADQLSASVEALDKYRIRALVKLLRSAILDPVQRQQVLNVLRHKCRVYGAGCQKRGRVEEAAAILALPQVLSEEEQRTGSRTAS
jgi:glycosyltransferase involved in cell wall biosynthesis